MTRATIATENGDIDVELFTTDAPKAAKNFVDLAQEGLLRRGHLPPRASRGFVIQGGDGQYGKKSSLDRGRVGHGRAGLQVRGRADQGRLRPRERWRWPTPGRTRTAASSSSATHDLTGRLPKNYTLFGLVTKGMDVVDKIVSRRGTRVTCRTTRSR